LSTAIDDAITQRIAFLYKQLAPDNKPEVNDTFQHQINILQTIDLEKLDRSIAMRKEHLKKSKDTHETDRLFCELEALEWVEREVKRHEKK
jgi:tetrahydromethanopterin S-methyltransferase subunit A